MQLDKEIKDLEEEIEAIKKFKSGQNGVEKNNLLNELKTKTMKLIQKQDKYENEYKRKIDEFKQLKNLILNFHISLECSKLTADSNKLLMENGVNETNYKLYLSDIENKLKMMQKFFEIETMEMEDFDVNNRRNDNVNNKERINPKQVADNMKIAFASMGKLNSLLNFYFNFEINVCKPEKFFVYCLSLSFGFINDVYFYS